MNIRQEENAGKGAFYSEANGTRLAEVTYTLSGTQKVIIEHTTVSEMLQGQGMGKKLVAAVVEMARSKGLKVHPMCPYAKKVFDQKPEYGDVRA